MKRKMTISRKGWVGYGTGLHIAVLEKARRRKINIVETITVTVRARGFL